MKASAVQRLADDRGVSSFISPFETFGDFAAAIAADGALRQASQPPSGSAGSPDVRLFAATGLSTTSGADGGFLLPQPFLGEVWAEITANPLALLPWTDRYPVEGSSLTMPAAAGTTLAGSVHGGVVAYRPAEGGQITTSKAQVRALRLEPEPIHVLVPVTEKLLSNAGAGLTRFLRKASADALNQRISYEVVNGTGAGQLLGLLNSGATITVTKESGQAAATFTYENASKMWARLLPASRLRATWLVNPALEPQLDQFAVGVGPANQFGYRPAEAGAPSPYPTLKGRPIIWCDACSAVGTEGDVILADLGLYAVGVPAAGVTEAASIHVRFEYAETQFRFTLAIDGQPWLASALTPAVGSDSLSSCVTVATRA